MCIFEVFLFIFIFLISCSLYRATCFALIFQMSFKTGELWQAICFSDVFWNFINIDPSACLFLYQENKGISDYWTT